MLTSLRSVRLEWRLLAGSEAETFKALAREEAVSVVRLVVDSPVSLSLPLSSPFSSFDGFSVLAVEADGTSSLGCSLVSEVEVTVLVTGIIGSPWSSKGGSSGADLSVVSSSAGLFVLVESFDMVFWYLGSDLGLTKSTMLFFLASLVGFVSGGPPLLLPLFDSCTGFSVIVPGTPETRSNGLRPGSLATSSPENTERAQAGYIKEDKGITLLRGIIRDPLRIREHLYFSVPFLWTSKARTL
jgi:hypothetical protein